MRRVLRQVELRKPRDGRGGEHGLVMGFGSGVLGVVAVGEVGLVGWLDKGG